MDILSVPALSGAIDYGLNYMRGNTGNAVLFGKVMSGNMAQAISTGLSAFVAQSTKHIVIPKIPASENSKKLIAFGTPALLCGGASYLVNKTLISGSREPGMDAVNAAVSYGIADFAYKSWSGKRGIAS
jgi:hypothetical protein